jgi:hypothetical protein
MLHPLKSSALAALILSSNLLAVDISKDNSQDISGKKDKSYLIKRSKDERQSERMSDNNSKSAQHTVDITFDTFPVYLLRADSCVKTLISPADIGLSSDFVGPDGQVLFDVYKQQLIDTAARSSKSVESVGGDSVTLKKYLQCSISNYARMAQTNLVLSRKLGKRSFGGGELMTLALNNFDAVDSYNPMIAKTEAAAIKSLSSNDCRFLGNSNVVQCGSVSIDFGQNSIKFGNALLSPGQDKFFGVAASFRVSLSDSVTRANEMAEEFSKSHAKDVSLSATVSTSISSSNKQQVNIAPFLPK